MTKNTRNLIDAAGLDPDAVELQRDISGDFFIVDESDREAILEELTECPPEVREAIDCAEWFDTGDLDTLSFVADLRQEYLNELNDEVEEALEQSLYSNLK